MRSFKDFMKLSEMTVGLGDFNPPANPYNDEHNRVNYYSQNQHLPVYEDLGDNKKVHVRDRGKTTELITLDHEKGEALHSADFEKFGKGKFSFPYQIQQSVMKGPGLPPHHAAHITLDHIQKTGTPLVTSEHQFNGGHDMWKYMTKVALNNGMHVYHFDGTKRTFTKSTPENIDEHLNNYVGDVDTPKSRNKLIISSHEL